MKLIIHCMALLIMTTGTAAAGTPVNSTFFGNKAIEGYDPVAYFVESQPRKGSRDFETRWNGVNWRFSTAGNQQKFVANPLRYAPQYGGYCAFAMAKGDRVGIDPSAWKIVNGKLYLNYSKKIQHQWEAKQTEFISEADRRWVESLN